MNGFSSSLLPSGWHPNQGSPLSQACILRNKTWGPYRPSVCTEFCCSSCSHIQLSYSLGFLARQCQIPTWLEKLCTNRTCQIFQDVLVQKDEGTHQRTQAWARPTGPGSRMRPWALAGIRGWACQILAWAWGVGQMGGECHITGAGTEAAGSDMGSVG